MKKKEIKEDSKEIRVDRLDDIPGLGPVSKKALAERGITSFLAFWAAMNNPTKIVQVTGMKKEIAVKCLQFVRDELTKRKLIPEMQMGADVYYDQILKRLKLKLGCSNIDGIMRGGFEQAIVHELYGHEGSGKTQLLNSLCINASKRIMDGGLYDEDTEGEKKPYVLYIDTENTFRPDRLQIMLASRKMIAQIPKNLELKKIGGETLTVEESVQLKEAEELQLLEAKEWMSDRIIHWKCQNAAGLFALLENANALITSGFPIKLVIIDSITKVFRGKYIGRGTVWSKSDDMNEIMVMLTSMAEVHKLVMVITSQVYSSPDGKPWDEKNVGYGGHIIGHQVQVRIKLEKPSGNMTAKKNKFMIVKAAHLPPDETLYSITPKGIENFVEKRDE